MSDQPVTADDVKRMVDDYIRTEPRRQARAEFIARQQARIDGLDGVPAEYLKGIGDDPERWAQEAQRARLQWLFDTGKASSSDAMQLGLMNSKAARETPTTTLNLKDFTGGGGGGGPNRAA